MNHAQLIDHFGNGTKAAKSIGVSKVTICRFNQEKSYFARLESHHQIRAMNLSNGELVADEKAIEFARRMFPNGVSGSALAELIDAA